MTLKDNRMESIRENADFILRHQFAVECNTQMEDVLAVLANTLHAIADELEALRSNP